MALSVGVYNGRQRPRLCGSSAQFVAKLAASPSRTVVTAVQVGQLSSLSPRSFGSSFALRTSHKYECWCDVVGVCAATHLARRSAMQLWQAVCPHAAMMRGRRAPSVPAPYGSKQKGQSGTDAPASHTG